MIQRILVIPISRHQVPPIFCFLHIFPVPLYIPPFASQDLLQENIRFVYLVFYSIFTTFWVKTSHYSSDSKTAKLLFLELLCSSICSYVCSAAAFQRLSIFQQQPNIGTYIFKRKCDQPRPGRSSEIKTFWSKQSNYSSFIHVAEMYNSPGKIHKGN